MENTSLSIKLFLVVCALPVLTLTARFETNAAAHGHKEIFHPLIFGGRAAVPGKFPYQVLLNVSAEGKIFTCGGSIISRNYILTAAHCIDKVVDKPEDVSVRAGSVIYMKGGVVKGVTEVIPHPHFRNYSNDIAILKLDSPLRYDRTIQPIRLGTTQVPYGAPVIISGWGKLPDGKAAKRLQYHIEYALSYEECVERIGIVSPPRSYEEYAERIDTLSPSMRCFDKRVGTGMCIGDSGGPAVYGSDLIGVAALVKDGCGNEIPDVYTDVISKRDWILGQIKSQAF